MDRITDIVAEDALTPEQRAERGSHVGCIAGALSFSEFEAGLRDPGVTQRLAELGATPARAGEATPAALQAWTRSESAR